MKWSKQQPKKPGIYVRCHEDGRLLAAYEIQGSAIDPAGGGLWFGPLPEIPRELLPREEHEDGCPMCGRY